MKVADWPGAVTDDADRIAVKLPFVDCGTLRLGPYQCAKLIVIVCPDSLRRGALPDRAHRQMPAQCER